MSQLANPTPSSLAGRRQSLPQTAPELSCARDFRQQQAGFQQQSTFQQQQQQFQQPPQQAVDPRDVPETFRGNLEAQPDFRITRFPQVCNE